MTTTKLSCAVVELLQQFTLEKGHAHVILQPYTMNGVGRGCELKVFGAPRPGVCTSA